MLGESRLWNNFLKLLCPSRNLRESGSCGKVSYYKVWPYISWCRISSNSLGGYYPRNYCTFETALHDDMPNKMVYEQTLSNEETLSQPKEGQSLTQKVLWAETGTFKPDKQKKVSLSPFGTWQVWLGWIQTSPTSDLVTLMQQKYGSHLALMKLNV